MKQLVASLAALAFLAAGSVFAEEKAAAAADDAKAKCEAKADKKKLEGDKRAAFMKKCEAKKAKK